MSNQSVLYKKKTKQITVIEPELSFSNENQKTMNTYVSGIYNLIL